MIRFTKLAAVTIAMAASPFLAQAAEDFTITSGVPGVTAMSASALSQTRGAEGAIIVGSGHTVPAPVGQILYEAQMRSDGGTGLVSCSVDQCRGMASVNVHHSVDFGVEQYTFWVGKTMNPAEGSASIVISTTLQ